MFSYKLYKDSQVILALKYLQPRRGYYNSSQPTSGQSLREWEKTSPASRSVGEKVGIQRDLAGRCQETGYCLNQVVPWPYSPEKPLNVNQNSDQPPLLFSLDSSCSWLPSCEISFAFPFKSCLCISLNWISSGCKFKSRMRVICF